MLVDLASSQLIWKNKVSRGGHYLAFSDSSDALVAATEGGSSAYYFDSKTGKTLWEFSDKDSKDFSFKSATIHGHRIILSGEERAESRFDAIFVLNEKGRLLGQKRLAPESIRRFRNNHVVSAVDGKIAVPEKDSVEVLDIPNE